MAVVAPGRLVVSLYACMVPPSVSVVLLCIWGQLCAQNNVISRVLEVLFKARPLQEAGAT